MAKYIKLEELMRFPIRRNHYDKEHGSKDFIYGIETVLEYAENLQTTDVVQEWISVKEHLPQENEPVGTLCETVQVLLNNGKVSVGWCNRRTKLWWHMEYDEDYFISKDYDQTPVIAWQPLAQPPKGE